MSRTSTKKQSAKTQPAAEQTKIVTSTSKEKTKVLSKSNDQVLIACGLQLGIKFTDVDTPNGGLKSIEFPGVNAMLKGKRKAGVLLGPGNATLVSISRADWECIKSKHGSETYFHTEPPLLWEMKSQEEFEAREDEVAEMRTGLEPIEPESVQVMQANKED